MTDYQVISGTSTGLSLNSGYISSGGIAVIFSGGTADQTTVASGGELVVLPGGIANDTTGLYADIISSGAVIFASGTDIVQVARGHFYGPPVGPGEVEFVLAMATAGATTVSGGFEFVISGGNAGGMNVESGGYEIVSSGGSATNTLVGSGGTLIELPGAITSGSSADGGRIITSGVVLLTENDGVYAEVLVSAGNVRNATVHKGVTAYVLAGGTMPAAVDSGTVEVFSGGIVVGTSVVKSSAEIVHSGGVDSNVALSGGGFEQVSGGGSAVSTIVGSGSIQYVYSGGVISDTDILSGGTIDVTDFAFDGGGTKSFNSTNDVLTVSENGLNLHLQLAGSYAGAYFGLSEDALGGTMVSVDGTPCYCRGTNILTDEGEVAVENLAIGDRLITRSGEARRLRWIGRRDYEGSTTASPDLLPILI